MLAPPGVPGSTTTTAPPHPAASPADYARLLITPQDIDVPGDGYTAQAPVVNPNGNQGAEVLLVNHDQTRAVGVMIVALADPPTAAGALRNAPASLGNAVTGGHPLPAPVGTGGTVVSGMSPDKSKAVKVLLFTEGRAFARVEFDTLPGQDTPDDFVTDVGQKQAIALRVGLPG